MRKSTIFRRSRGRNHEKNCEFPSKVRRYFAIYLGVVWSKRSKQSKMLIGSMLNKNYEERPSASEVLNSEWIKNSIIYDSDEVGE